MSGLNTNAKPFSFNVGASSFSPGGAAPAPKTAPAPKPAAVKENWDDVEEVTEKVSKLETAPPPDKLFAQEQQPVRETAPHPSKLFAQQEPVRETAPHPSKLFAQQEPVRETAPPPSKLFAQEQEPVRETAPPPSKLFAQTKSTPAPAAKETPKPNVSPKPKESSKPKAKESAADKKKNAEMAKKAASAAECGINIKVRETLPKRHDEREHINIVFIGHVDAGKSTLSGQILVQTAQVDERVLAKYEKEAKEKNRDSWYLAYIMDTGEDERAKGKTVETGKAAFSTEKKRFTMLDAPGHKNFVPNMIAGTAQADVGVLVISARRGEFETGFEKGGQTREHAMLAKTLGIDKLVVLVNKMDESTVNWSQERFDEIENKLTPFLKMWGFAVKKDVYFVPGSGYTGANLKDRVSSEICPWYKGKSFFDVLDGLPVIDRSPQSACRIPVQARYKDMGQVAILGKVEAGVIEKDMDCVLMPSGKEFKCIGVDIDESPVDCAHPGENVIIKCKGIEEEDIQVGCVVSEKEYPCRRTKKFRAQITVTELLEHKPIVTGGYAAILHLHTLEAECEISKLVAEINRKTGERKKTRYIKNGGTALVEITVDQSIALESFKDFPQMGRFTLRDEGRTIAIGTIKKIQDM